MKIKNIYKKIIIATLTTIFVVSNVLFVFVQKTNAAFNRQINYQGKLTNASNIAVADGSYSIVFRLYTSGVSATSTALWTETDSVTLNSGLFSVMMGSTTPFTGIDFNQTLYLGVTVGTDGEMTPRKVIGSVPSAFVADTLNGISSNQFVRNDIQNATSSTGTFMSFLQNGAGKVAEFFGAGSNSALSILSAGNVGIGTTTPGSKFSVAGNGYFGGNVIATGTLAVTSTSTSGGLQVNGAGTITGALNVSGNIIGNLVGNVTGNITGTSTYFSGNLFGDITGTQGATAISKATIISRLGSAASGVDGYLLGTDWNTFNGKLSTTTAASTYVPFNGATSPVNLGSQTFTTTGTITSGLINGQTISSTANFTGSLVMNGAFSNTSASNSYFTGNLGIGTTSPLSRLSIQGSGNTSASSGLNVTGLDGGSHLLVRDDGNVGIGTTTPQRLLSVNGSALFGSNVNNPTATPLNVSFGGDYGTNSVGSQANLKWDMYNANGSNRYGIGMSAGMMEFQAGSNNDGNFSWFTGNSTERMRLTTAGNVGIGTTSPSNKLEVAGNSYFGGNITATGTITLPSFTAGSIPYITSIKTLQQDNANFFWDAQYHRLGIGTTTPQSVLSVIAGISSGSSVVTLKNTTGGGGGGVLNVSNTGGNLDPLATFTNYGQAAVAIFNGGNVGIGTTSPSNKLEVAGSGYFTGNVTGANITATGTLNVSGATTLASSLNGLLWGNNGSVSAVATSSLGLQSALTGGVINSLTYWTGSGTLGATSSPVVASITSIGTSTFPILRNGEVLIKHSDGSQTSYVATTSTDIARGNTLLDAVNKAISGDVIYLSSNIFDIQSNGIDLSKAGTASISIHGSGKYSTVIKSSLLSSNIVIVHTGINSETTDLSIIATSLSTTGNQFPWGSLRSEATYNYGTSTLRNVFMSAQTDGIVIDNDGTAIVDNVSIKTNWDGINFNISGVTMATSSSILIYNSDITSQYNGRINDLRGIFSSSKGTIKIYNTDISVSGGIDSNAGIDSNGGTIYMYSGSIITSGLGALNYDVKNELPTAVLAVNSGVKYDTNKIYGSITYLDSNQIVASIASTTMNVVIPTSLGLGSTNAPGHVLDVIGSSFFECGDLYNGFTVFDTPDAQNRLKIDCDTGLVNLNDSFYITTGGDVGVGSTTPAAKFAVAGNSYFGGNITATGTLTVAGKTTLANASTTNITNSGFLNVTGTTTTNGLSVASLSGLLWGTNGIVSSIATSSLGLGTSFFQQNGNSFGAVATLGTNDSQNLIFKTNNTTAMAILANGNIGVGTTTPASKFDVFGDITLSGTARTISASSYMALGGANGSQLTISGGNGSGAGGGSAQFAGGTGSAGGNTTISSGGGTTAGTLNLIGGAASVGGAINITGGAGGTGGIVTINGGTGGGSILANVILASTGGNVGIGTVSPNGQLQINTANSATQSLILAGTPQSGSSDTTNGIAFRLGYNGSGNRQLWLGDSAQAGVSGNSSFRYIVGFPIPLIDAISNDGNTRRNVGIASQDVNVGIGVNVGTQVQADITGKLHVFAEAGKVGLVVAGASAQSSDYINVNSNGNTTGNIFAIKSSGNVGIGTTSPGEKLEVNGAIKSTGGATTNLASSVALDFSGGARILSWGANTSTVGTFKVMQLQSNGGGILTPISIDTAGVTTVAGSSASGNLIVNTTSNAGSISLASLLAPSATGDTYFTVGRSLTSANTALVGLSSVGSSNNYAFLTTYGRPASDFIVSSNGNVGIGTTSPSNKLEVAGAGYFSGNLTAVNITATGTLTVTGTTTTNGLSVASLSGLLWGTNGAVSAVSTSTLGLASAPSLTALTSSLTLGHLTRWNGTSLIDSIFHDNGTVAGINATSSSYTFNVQGTSGVNPFNISSSTGTSLLTVLNNGNVGVGTNSPARPLDVRGDSSGWSTLQLQLTAASNANKFLALGYDTTNNISIIQSVEVGNGYKPLQLNPNGGTVAIGGSTAGSGNLTVGGGINFYGNLRSLTDGAFFSFDAGSDRIGFSKKSGNFGAFSYGSASSFNIDQSSGTTIDPTSNTFIHRLTIDSNGNVGIGSTTPSSLLTVSGNGYFGGNLIATGTLAISGATTLSSTLNVSGTTTVNNFIANGVSTFNGTSTNTQNLYVAGTCLGCGSDNPNNRGFQAFTNAISSVTSPNIKVAAWGDSLTSYSLGFLGQLQAALIKKYGYAGFDGDQAHQSVSGTTAYVTDYTRWTNGQITELGSGGTYWSTDAFLGTATTPSDTLKVYYVARPGGGTFKIQSSIDGSSWSDEAGYTSINTNTATSGVAVKITKTFGPWAVRAVGITGTTTIISIGQYDSTSHGVVGIGTMFGLGGTTAAQQLTVSTSIFNPIVQSANPTMFLYDMKETPGNETYLGVPTSYPTLLQMFVDRVKTAQGTSTDILMLGSTIDSTDPSYTGVPLMGVMYDTILENKQIQAVAAANNLPYINLYNIFGTLNNASSTGMITPADLIHPTPAGNANIVQYILKNTPLGYDYSTNPNTVGYSAYSNTALNFLPNISWGNLTVNNGGITASSGPLVAGGTWTEIYGGTGPLFTVQDLSPSPNVMFRISRDSNNGTAMRSFGAFSFAPNNSDTVLATLTTTGSLGIGTTSPSEKLDVRGNIRVLAGGNSQGYLAKAGDGTYIFSATRESTLNEGLGLSAYGDIGLAPQNSVTSPSTNWKFIVKGATGNVGIGITNPLAKLEVNPSAVSDIGLIVQATTSQTADLQQWQNSSGTVLSKVDKNGAIWASTPVTTQYAASIYVGGTTATAGLGNIRGAYIGALHNPSSNDASTEVLGFLSQPQKQGSFSLGTLSGFQSLPDVSGGGTVTNVIGGDFRIGNSASIITNGYGIKIALPNNLNNAYGLYIDTGIASSTNWGIYQNNATKNYFAGNIGIGVTSPLAKLHLSGGDGANIFTNASIALGYSTTGQYPSFIHTRHAGGQNDGNAIDFYTGDGTAAGVFPTNAVLAMSVNGNKVGVGTSTPSAKLSIHDNSGLAGTNPVFVIASSTSAGLSTTTLLTVLGNGNVSIGTTAPTATLTVKQGAANNTSPFFRVERRDGATAETVNAIEYSDGGSTPNFYVTNYGNVRANAYVVGDNTRAWFTGNQGTTGLNIYNTYSATAIDIKSNVAADDRAMIRLSSKNGNTMYFGSAYDPNITGSNKNQYGFYGSGGASSTPAMVINDNWNAVGGNGHVGINNGNPLYQFDVKSGINQNPFNVASSSGTSLFNIIANGNVGIGTTSPSNKLEVAGAGYFTGNVTAPFFVATSTTASSTFMGAVGINTTNPLFDFQVTGDATWPGDIPDNGSQMSIVGSTNSNVRMNIGMDTSTVTGYIAAGNKGVAWGKLILQPGGGNVGIGTNNPGYGLEVAGNSLINAGTSVTSLLLGSQSAGAQTLSSNLVPDLITTPNKYDNTASGNSINKWSFFNIPGAAVYGIGMSVTNGFGLFAGDRGFTFATGVTNLDGTGASTKMVILNGGNVGIGSSTPISKLTVVGSTYLNGNATTTGSLFLTGLPTLTTGNYLCIDTTTKQITSGTTCSLSSSRFKENVKNIDLGLKTVLALNPVTFKFKKGYGDEGATTQLGFVAEQADSIDPRLVPHDENGLPSGFNYANYTAVLTKAIQEQQAQIDALKNATTTNTIIAQDAFTMSTSTIASTTSSILAESTSFITTIANAVKNMISNAGDWAIARLSATYVYSKKIEAETVSVLQGLEMKDQVTGQTYCVVIKNGDWDKRIGTCAEIAQSTTTPAAAPVIINTYIPSIQNQVITATTTNNSTSTPTIPIVSSTTTIDNNVVTSSSTNTITTISTSNTTSISTTTSNSIPNITNTTTVIEPLSVAPTVEQIPTPILSTPVSEPSSIPIDSTL